MQFKVLLHAFLREHVRIHVEYKRVRTNKLFLFGTKDIIHSILHNYFIQLIFANNVNITNE